ncbi:MAG: hypothetical protein H5T49_04025 [Hadesarchaea archaeon]|nr:hypothetical protein [Hadesarchaea archaeon]
MVENIKVGFVFFSVRLNVGGKSAEAKLYTPLWMNLDTYALWFKNYQPALTELFSTIFEEFGFELTGSGQNRAGYYAKFSTESQSFQNSIKLIRRLFEEGLLDSHMPENKLTKACFFRRLGAEK